MCFVFIEMMLLYLTIITVTQYDHDGNDNYDDDVDGDDDDDDDDDFVAFDTVVIWFHFTVDPISTRYSGGRGRSSRHGVWRRRRKRKTCRTDVNE